VFALRPRRARIAALAAVIVALAATAALAPTSRRDAAAVPHAQALVSGTLSMSNSHDGQAIFRANDLAPGGSATGTVTIRNTGTVSGALALSPGPAEVSGERGQALLDAMRLQIADVTADAQSAVYAGGLGELTPLALRTLTPGDARTYRFSATLPDGGAGPQDGGDNLLQHASMSVAYDWTLTETNEPPAGEPPVTPPPAAEPPLGAPGVGGSSHPAAPPQTAPRLPRACIVRRVGNAKRNLLTGSGRGDLIYGKGGADRIYGRGGRDCLWGGTGNDRVYGGAGADTLHGSTGRDYLVGNTGRDRLIGGFGNDRISARDGDNDTIDCGPGRDRALVDRGDKVRRCEIVVRPARRR
jgi:Ca2+-binding RTX toxin-like protein